MSSPHGDTQTILQNGPHYRSEHFFYPNHDNINYRYINNHMAIYKAHTEEFNWLDLGTTFQNPDGDEEMIFINDFAHKDFEDQGGKGLNSNAYKNWISINRPATIKYDYGCPAVVGSVIRDAGTGETYLSPGNLTPDNAVDFKTDGLFFMPSPGQVPKSYPYHTSSYSEAYSTEPPTIINYAVEYHCKDAAGLTPGIFYPLLQYTDMIDTDTDGINRRIRDGVGEHTSFRQVESFDSWLRFQQSNDADEQWVCGGYHRSVMELRSALPDECVRNDLAANFNNSNYSTPRNDHPWGDTVKKPRKMISTSGFQDAGSHQMEVIVWYAHDGQGNAMLISTDSLVRDKNTMDSATGSVIYGQGTHYNSHFIQTSDNAADPTTSPFLVNSSLASGQIVFNVPKQISNMPGYGTPDFIHQFAEVQRQAGTRLLVDPNNTENMINNKDTTNGTYDRSFGTDGNASSVENNHGTHSYVLSFPTNVGTADQAAFKTPVTMYSSLLSSPVALTTYGAWYAFQTFKIGGMQVSKFPMGNMDRYGRVLGIDGKTEVFNTNNRPMNEATIIRQFSYAAVASHTGNIGINRATWNTQQTDTVTTMAGGVSFNYDYNIDLEFSTPVMSYNALSGGNTVTDSLSAWTDKNKLFDTSSTGAVATKSGIENALIVQLNQSHDEGETPTDTDPVDMVTLHVANMRKLVIGAVTLNFAIYQNDNGALGTLLVGPRRFTGEQSLSIEQSQTVVFDDFADGNLTYGDLKDALVVIYAEESLA